MNFLWDINQFFADLLINYLNLIKERSSCPGMFCSKGVFQRIPLVAASERVNAGEAAPLLSVAAGKEDISGEA